eukprot:2112295-Amphidinium_carterae.1
MCIRDRLSGKLQIMWPDVGSERSGAAFSFESSVTCSDLLAQECLGRGVFPGAGGRVILQVA